MSYIDGIVAPVRAGVDAATCRAFAETAATIFTERGATRLFDA